MLHFLPYLQPEVGQDNTAAGSPPPYLPRCLPYMPCRGHSIPNGHDAAAAARPLRLESVAAQQQQSVEGMSRQVEKLRGRVRLVSQDLTLPLKEVSGKHSD